jgi:DNA-nicking Smr family endonuclease
MARRGPKRDRDLPDYHLWVEVKRTVAPLRPDPELDHAPPALPLPPKPDAPTRVALTRPLVIGERTVPAPAVAPPPMPRGRIIEPGVKRRVSRGQIELDARIDLHGMRQAEAREALGRFLRNGHSQGARTLLVITGKGGPRRDGDVGGGFPGGFMGGVERGILRTMLPVWLAEPELRPLVAGFDVAARGHGGEGAFYVRLRRGPA